MTLQTLRRMETVPGTTRLTVDLDGMLHLPEGASYTLCQDGIRATLVRKGDSLMVEATAEKHLIEEATELQAESQEEEAARQDEPVFGTGHGHIQQPNFFFPFFNRILLPDFF